MRSMNGLSEVRLEMGGYDAIRGRIKMACNPFSVNIKILNILG